MDKFCICGARVECDSGGYPVVDGSAEWALWQMEQGKWVYNPSLEKHKSDKLDTRYLHAYGKFGQDVVVKNILTEIDSILGSANISHWTNYAEPTGWQLYKEPKPEQKPSPSFKVGDWVRGKSGYAYKITAYPSKLLPDNPNVYDAIPASSMYGPSLCLELSDIESKLKPSEVVVHIGCLSGTVRPVTTNGIHIRFHLIDVDDKIIATIRISSLDAHTREIVESLLEAQEEE